MNIGRISTIQCVTVVPPPDLRCDDEAFRLANPDLCPPQPRLILKPGTALICELSSVAFQAFTVMNGVETDVTTSTIFQSSDSNVALIGATTGQATGTGAGAATISAAYKDMEAQAELTVMAGEACCDGQTVAMMVLVDQTRSMTQQFSSSFSTKLAYAKYVATTLIESVNENKDLVGLARFTKNLTKILSDPIADKTAVAALIPQILQTQEDTTFYDAIAAAITSLDSVTADRKVLVIFSDGEDTTPSYVEYDENPIKLTDNFKAAGGIVASFGIRAHDAGYNLLSALSTGGFFLNAFDATEDTSIDYIVKLKGYLCAGNCTPTGDSTENRGALSFTDLTNWEISGGGTVDLLGNGFFDYLPGNGLYLDLIGDGTPANPLLVTKDAFAVSGGSEYRVTVRLAGNHVFADELATVQVSVRAQSSGTVWLQNILIPDYKSPFTDYLSTFVVPSDDTVKIEIRQIASIGLPIPDDDQRSGILVDLVSLTNVTQGSILFSDNFDDENPVYVPPQCGQGTIPQEIGTDTTKLILTGAGTDAVNGEYDEYALSLWNQVGGDYRIVQDFDANTFNVVDALDVVLYTCDGLNFPTGPWEPVTGDAPGPDGEYATIFGYSYGYNCYGDGCLDSPPIAQLSDPRPLPVLESGPVTPGRFTSTKTACAYCPNGYINIGVALTADTLTDGEEYETVVQLDDPTALAFYQVHFQRTWIPDGSSPYQMLTLEGSEDGDTWETLDVRDKVFVIPGLTLTYQISPASAEYSYYRASIGTGMPTGSGKVMSLSVFGVAENPVCRSAAGVGGTQAEADNNAMFAAENAAQAAIRCMFMHTANASYTASCPYGYSGTSTQSAVGSSLNSSEEAHTIAEDAAREAAEYTLTCVPTTPDYIGGEDGEAIGDEGGNPIPS